MFSEYLFQEIVFGKYFYPEEGHCVPCHGVPKNPPFPELPIEVIDIRNYLVVESFGDGCGCKSRRLVRWGRSISNCYPFLARQQKGAYHEDIEQPP